MKRQLLFIFFSLFFIFSSSAQVGKSGLSFNEKRQLKKALKVEAYTVDGYLHKGYLYYADNEKIFLTENPFLNQSLIAIQFGDLYQIKVISHIPFGKRFLNGIFFSAVTMSLITAEMYSHGDAIMIGPEAVIVAGTTVFGTPFSLLLATVLPKERTDFEYRTDGQIDAFETALPFFLKRQFTTVHPLEDQVVELKVEKDSDALSYVLDPLESLHPEATRNLHFYFGAGASLVNSGKQLDRIFTDNEGLTTGYYRSDRFSFRGKVQFNASNAIRPYLSLTFGETGYGSGIISQQQDANDYLYIDYSLFYGHLGADYIFNPTDNMGLFPFEFSISGGLSYGNLNFKYKPNKVDFYSQSVDKKYSSFGLLLGGQVDYFVSRNLSFSLGLTSDIMFPIKIDPMHYESTNLGLIDFDGVKFNTSNIYLNFGLSLHL